MKFCRVFFIVFFSLFLINLNAQVFVGGKFRFYTSNHKTDDGATTTDKRSNYSFDLSPEVGKFLSEKFAIGFALDISLSGNRSGVNNETLSKSSSFGGSPFLRYYAIRWNKVSVFGQGNIGLAFSNSSEKTGGVTTDGPKGTNLYITVYPGLSYDISDKLSLQTSLNILSFDYNYLITKDGSSKDKRSSFNIGAGLGNIVSLDAITIGAIYKF
jgi:hypothetical protein